MQTNHSLLLLIFSFACSFLNHPSFEVMNNCSDCDEFTEPYTSFKIYDNKILMPNVYDLQTMPDGYFPDLLGQNIIISSFTIYTPEEWNEARIMYSSKHMNYLEEIADNGWNGTSRYTDDTYTTNHEGLFRYSFYASVDNKGLRFEGWACLSRGE